MTTLRDMHASTMLQPPQRIPYALRDCGDVSAVRLDVVGTHFVAVCGCGWRTPHAEHVREAIAGWFTHRDRLS